MRDQPAGLCFLSGWACTADVWQPLQECLSFAGSKRFFTLADLHSAAADASAYATAFLKCLAELPAPPIVVAWSIGAMIALEAALLHPAAVAAMVLISAAARFCRAPDYTDGVPPAVLRAMRSQLRRRPAKVLEDFFRLAGVEEADGAPPLTWLVEKGLSLTEPVLESGLLYLERVDLRRQLCALKVPLVLVHGQDDRVVPVAAARYLAGYLPQADFRLLPGGHLLPYERPAELAVAVKMVL